MADPLTIAMIAGAGLQAFGQYQSGQAQARAARQQAKLKKVQANELLERMRIQEGRFREQGEAYKAKQTADYAGNGVAVGTGATLVAMEDTNFKISQQIEDMQRDTLFRVNQLRLGAKYEVQQGNDAATAGAIMAGGSILEGYADYKKNIA